MRNYDVVIAGGAVMGSSIAFHLASDPGFDGRVLVVDKDLTYAKAASALSLSSIRQQFSTALNIRVSLHGVAFLRRAAEHLAVDGDAPAIGLKEGGYLYLASPAGAATLTENHALQSAEGADILLMTPDELRRRFPWIRADDLGAAAWGRSGEGWFDGYGLTQAFARKARSLGVTYMQGEVAALRRAGGRIVEVDLADGGRIGCGAFVDAAGASGARRIAMLAGVDIPVRSRKRCVFSFTTKERIPDCPLMIDTTGVYVRAEHDMFLCGVSPPEAQDPDSDDFEVEWTQFDDIIWPALAARSPVFEALRPGRAWAGHYDMNLFDHNAIAGRLPGLDDAFLAAGFSGHGMQQSPAVGRGMAELIAHGAFTTLDLGDFAFERIARGKRIVEKNVI